MAPACSALSRAGRLGCLEAVWWVGRQTGGQADEEQLRQIEQPTAHHGATAIAGRYVSVAASAVAATAVAAAGTAAAAAETATASRHSQPLFLLMPTQTL